MRSLVVVSLTLWASISRAAPAEPTGAHPRMLLDAELKAAWKSSTDRGPVKGSIALCQNARETADHDRAVYQGSEWAKILQACLVAWAATDSADHAKTAIRFFNALLDDLDRVGDAAGGDKAATRDDGYAIRNLGPYTAIAYDWLHDKLTPEQRAKARGRWKAWLDWYKEKGYRARVPGTNYQAGYLVAATTIAIAQGGEAAEQGGPALWQFVTEELWGKDMASALSTNGILDGGDWPEGWQYGPLAVASYSLSARVAKRAGIDVQGVDAWLSSLMRRHVYGLSPSDRVFAAGDTEDEKAHLEPSVMTLNAIALGDTTPDDKSWAKGELSRLKLVDRDYLLYDALATVGDKPTLAPRDKWPTWYVADNTGTLYARTRWDDKAVWFVTECQHTLEIDHRSPNAGNFVLSRGPDDAIVNPTPYGSRSTLTGNAPTVASSHLPADYIPSQGYWGQTSGTRWATQTKSGIAAARCDYADQYRFQSRDSDVPEAIRDYVLVPGADGQDAMLVVIDRANTTSGSRAMHLRFRSPQLLALDGDVAKTTVGKTLLEIRALAKSSGTPKLFKSEGKDCFKEGIAKGRCEAARFPVTDFRLELAGPTPRAVHTIAVSGAALPAATKLDGEGYSGVRMTAPREAIVVWPAKPKGALTYKAPKGASVSHVVLDGPDTDGKATIAAKLEGNDCVVTMTAGGEMASQPAVFTLDANCAVTADPLGERAAAGVGKKPPARAMPGKTNRRSGCCGANAAPGSPLAMTIVVGGLLLRRRRRSH